MKKRDLEILKSLEKFKVLSSGQIAEMHFKENAYPQVTANRVLKRLRNSQHVIANTDRSFQQYLYFVNPAPIKVSSQKIDHYLMIGQGFIDMQKYSNINNYQIEPKIENADFIPDVKASWLDNEWYIEFQNSLYSTKQLYEKLNRYVCYYNKGLWKNERVLIVGKINMKFNPDDYPFKVKQVHSIDDLRDTIKTFKEMKYSSFKGNVRQLTKTPVSFSNTVTEPVIKSQNGGIKFSF
ncbi:replication-relaxation family protein [Bacillus infantis]|uniref:replication-relaxation family protein n=1 Tax=Bacillus infantis TaxID=324767 RepID=UPI003CF43266